MTPATAPAPERGPGSGRKVTQRPGHRFAIGRD